MNNKLTAGLLLSLISFGLQAEIYYLDIDKSIEIAREKSYSMLSHKQDIIITESNMKATTAGLKTHVDLDFTLPQYTETIRSFEDTSGLTYYPVRQLNYSGRLNVNQPLITDGRLYLTGTLNNTDDIYNSKRLMNLNTRIGFSQPLNAFYGYNNVRSSMRQAKLNYEQSQKRLKREELNMVYNVMSSFYNLLQVQKSMALSASNLERQNEAYELARNKYAAGLIKEVDVLQMEVDLAEARNNYDIALINQASVANNFKELIGLDIRDSVVLDMNMDYKIVMVDMNKAVDLAMKNRLEIREQEIQVELSKMSIKRTKANGLPSASLTAYFEKSGISEMVRDNEIGASLKRATTDYMGRPHNYGVGLTVSVPVVDFGENRAQVRSAKASLQKTLYQQEVVRRNIESEVRNLVTDVNSSIKRLQLLEKNIEIAEKSFEITRARYADGDVDSQTLALERDRLNNAYTSHLQAYINYQLKLADLMRNTFYDFVNGVEIE